MHQNAAGKLTVLGVMLKEGDKSDFIKDVWQHFPKQENKVEATNTVINALDLMPAQKQFFAYAGSLTTPPCYQGVNWVVFKSSMELSKDQLKKFPHHESARPLQPLNGRVVIESVFPS